MEPIGPSHQVAELVVDAHEQDEQAIYSALSTPDNTNTSSSTSTKVPIPYTYHVPPQQSSSSKDRNFSLTQPSLIDLLSTQVPRADVSFLASYKAAVQQAEQKVASISFEPLMKSDGKNQQSNKEKRKTLLQEEDEDDAPPSQEAGPRSLDEELADWVGSKPARWLELLTKFGAASGLFFISGDALIIELLRESRLSWGFGAPQLLHFAFIVERFLKQLLDSGCQFRVIFFRDMRRALYNLKLRSVDNADVGAAALLARDIIASHLKNVESLDVNDTIDNWWTDEWKQYLSTSPIDLVRNASSTSPNIFAFFFVGLQKRRFRHLCLSRRCTPRRALLSLSCAPSACISMPRESPLRIWRRLSSLTIEFEPFASNPTNAPGRSDLQRSIWRNLFHFT